MADKRPYGLHKRADSPNWRTDFWVNRRRIARSTKTGNLRKAIEAAARLAEEAGAETVVGRKRKKRPDMTLDAAFTRFYEEHSPNIERPLELLTRLERLADRLGADRPLSDIDMDDLLRYRTQRQTEVANRTVNSDLMDTLRPVYKRACLWGVEVGPVGQADFPWKELKLRPPKPRVRWLTRKEKAQLYLAVSKDYRPLVKFALLTGLRATPLRIEKSQIDFDMGLIVYEKKSKFERDLGFIPITGPIERLLRSELAKSPERCKEVFTFRARRTVRGKVRGQRYPITYEGFKSEMQRAVERAGLPDWRLIHDLRHTAATEVLRASGDITALRDMLGHSQVSQTEKYAHVVTDDVRRAMEAPKHRVTPKSHRFGNIAEKRSEKSKLDQEVGGVSASD